jgi:hypothetical protein
MLVPTTACTHCYSSYRLVPGLNVLVPLDKDELVDGYLLNLFSCKPDRATKLADRGFLVDTTFIKRLNDTKANGVWASP